MITKVCTKCTIVYTIDMFSRRGNGTQSHCKKCNKQNNKYSRNNQYKHKYGITLDDYNILFKQQDGKCKICNTTNPGRRYNHLSVDHCHTTGTVRGLLCSNCNIGLGSFKDSLESLTKAIAYLKGE